MCISLGINHENIFLTLLAFLTYTGLALIPSKYVDSVYLVRETFLANLLKLQNNPENTFVSTFSASLIQSVFPAPILSQYIHR